MTKLKIKVDRDCLERSRDCGDSFDKLDIVTNCAISLAISDIFPNTTVSGEFIGFYKSDVKDRAWFSQNSYCSVELPEEAKKFVCKFDSSSSEERAKLPEIEFEIELPEEVLNEIDLEELKPLLKNSKTLELV